MAGAKIALSGVAGELADDGNGAAKVNLPTVDTQAGYVIPLSEVDDGTLSGARGLRSGEVTTDSRLRVGLDNPMLDVSFEGSIVAGTILSQATSGMTIAQGGGFLALNNANAVTATNRAQVTSYRTFPLFGSFPTYAEFWLREANQSAVNAISEWGFGYPGGGVTAPTDGVFIRRISGGVLQVVLNFAGTETAVTLNTATAPSRDGAGVYDPAETNHWVISVHNDTVEIWLNNVRISVVPVPQGQGSPMSSSAQGVFARVYVPTGLTASLGRRIELAYIGVSSGDVSLVQPISTMAVGMGRGAYQTQAGVAVAQTANSVNSTVPANATLSNTAASYTTLGGQWRAAAVAGAETDYALFAFQNPAGTNALAGRNLFITNVRIGETWNEVVPVATTPTILQWAVAAGSTAASLATADGTNTVSPKRDVLGTQAFAVADAVGAIKPGFDSDVLMIVPPGCFFHVILKVPVGTATATEFFRGTVSVKGYYL